VVSRFVLAHERADDEPLRLEAFPVHTIQRKIVKNGKTIAEARTKKLQKALQSVDRVEPSRNRPLAT
jgi:hypothetical protein